MRRTRITPPTASTASTASTAASARQCVWHITSGVRSSSRLHCIGRRAASSVRAGPQINPARTRANQARPSLRAFSTSSAGGLSKGRPSGGGSISAAASVFALGCLLAFSLRPRGRHIHLQPPGREGAQREQQTGQQGWVQRRRQDKPPLDKTAESNLEEQGQDENASNNDGSGSDEGVGVWFRDIANIDWSAAADKVADFLLPDWSRMVPGFVRKLQRELSLAPGSLADEIWREARDPLVNPEVQYAARVRVTHGDPTENDLCGEERAFRKHRRRATAAALGRYLELPEDELPVHPDDVPVIALCGSGGGLRALVAGTGSLLAAAEDGLFDCVTYTAGVSGSCWLQALYFSSFTQQDLGKVTQHLKDRLGVHIAYPPDAFSLLTSAPTNKCLLAGVVEKLRADPGGATFGLVDVYGTLLAARLLVPCGELGVDARDFKLSGQRRYLDRGQQPLPIYTAVRHEIPALDDSRDKAANGNAAAATDGDRASEPLAEDPARNTEAQHGPWFQWFEVTPYEFFCEEFAAGIPTWALGRKFKAGRDVPPPPDERNRDEEPYRTPEVRLPLMLGIFGSAFCATLSHYYKEIRPVVQSLAGLGGLDDLIWGRNEDLSKVHPIEPATLPNPVYGMDPKSLPATVPRGVLAHEHIQLMDAGMSNNLPLYPFLRPGRGVEMIIVFDASADIKKDNWLEVADGYARQRGVKGWPVGVGWPPADASPAQTAQQLKEAGEGGGAGTSAEDSVNGRSGGGTTADDKLTQAKIDQAARQIESGTNEEVKSKTKKESKPKTAEEANAQAAARELGYCTVWVGSTEETLAKAGDVKEGGGEEETKVLLAPPLDASTQWRLAAPDAGLTLVYLPYLANEAKVPGVDPATSDYMSTWNFVYTPAQVDAAVALARANYGEGAQQIRDTVRAVYERKKQLRLAAEAAAKQARRRRRVRLGQAGRLEGDHFN